jgi:hypothetical protein
MSPMLRTLTVLLYLTGTALARPPSVDAVLDRVGGIAAHDFDPRTVIHAVNRLQPLGKTKGVAALRRWIKARKPAPYSGVFAVIRLLLAGPERPPALGGPVPSLTPDELKHLPNYPILALDDVPVTLVSGYFLGGLAEPPGMYLDRLARTGTWRTAPLKPKSVGSVLYTLMHFGLFPLDHPVMRLIHQQLQRYDGPPPATRAQFRQPMKAGDPFVVVQGGRLPAPVTVPLWLTITQPDPDGECPAQHEATLMMRPDGTLYVEQYNQACRTTGSGCQLYDPYTDRWQPLKACIDPGFGLHRAATALGEDWVWATGEAEGRSKARLIRWDPVKGQRTISEMDPADKPRWMMGGIWIRSSRALDGTDPGGPKWFVWDMTKGGWQRGDPKSAFWVGSF